MNMLEREVPGGSVSILPAVRNPMVKMPWEGYSTSTGPVDDTATEVVTSCSVVF